MKPKFLFQIRVVVALSFALNCFLVLPLQARSLARQQIDVQKETSPISNARRVELIRLVRQDCGSCHGLRLKGGLGPALLPDTLRELPEDSLLTVILQGRPGTAMPPWKRFLNEEEARWIVAQLQKGFPHEEP